MKLTKSEFVILLTPVVMLLVSLSLVPGVFLPDTFTQYNEFVTGNYIDWHPLAMNLLWSLTSYAGSVLILNLLLYYSGVIFFIYVFILQKKKFIAILSFIFFLNPFILLQLMVVVKDSGFLSSLVFCFGLLYFTKNFNLKSKYIILLLTPIVTYGTLLRYNAIFAFIPLIIYVLYNIVGIRKYFFMKCFITIAIYIVTAGYAANVINYTFYNAKHTYPQTIAMRYDLVGVYCESLNGLQLNRDLFNKEYNYSNICNDLKTNTSDNLFWSQDGEVSPFTAIVNKNEYDYIKNSYMSTIKQHPIDYIKFRWKVYSSSFEKFNWYFYQYSEIDPLFNIHVHNKTMYNLFHNVYEIFYPITQTHLILYVVCFQILLLLFYLYKRLFLSYSCIVLISGVFYQFMWFFMLPLPDIRYFNWSIVSLVISLLVFVSDIRKLINE